MESSWSQGENGKLVFPETPDEELLSRYVKSDDKAALDALWERHREMVLSLCLRVLHHRQDAEDAAQETFLVLMQKAAEIDTGEPIKGWLHRVAELVAGHILRSRIRRQAHEDSSEGNQPAQPVDEVVFRELQSILNKELHRLPEECRILFMLNRLEGKSRREIAQELGLAEGTVATRLKKACELLQQRLERCGITAPN